MSRVRLFTLLFPLALGLAAGVGCFSPPNDEVLFSCEFDGDDRCPTDYECRSDNCCHRTDTAADANVGDCALGGNSGVETTGTSGTETGASETGASETGETETGETATDSTDESGSDTGG